MLTAAFADLPPSPHVQVITIPGIGEATAAVLVAKIVDIHRFATPNQLVNYFGVFPEKDRSGVDKHGHPLPPGTMHMSRKGNDLVRSYLWNVSLPAIRFNPAIRALYRRLKAKGKRGDVVIGHCMRKLLHLVFAVWKTDRPFDPKHFPWEGADETETSTATPSDPSTEAAPSDNDKAVGRKRDKPAKEVVTTAVSTGGPESPPVKTPAQPASAPRPRLDFKYLLHEQVTMEQVLHHLGLLSNLRGRGLQRRGPCPLTATPDAERTFSVHLGKGAFQCFQADCAVKGNVLDLWAAIHRLPLYEAALHLAETFNLTRSREEEPVARTRRPQESASPSPA